MNYYSEKDIRDIVAKVVNSSLGAAESKPKAADSNEGILVEVSARHVHLTVEDVEKLFGKGYRLTPKKMLSQPGEFLSNGRHSAVCHDPVPGGNSHGIPDCTSDGSNHGTGCSHQGGRSDNECFLWTADRDQLCRRTFDR